MSRCGLSLRAMLFTIAITTAGVATAAELSVGDFKFDGPLGSQGTTIEKLDTNHFRVDLGYAPKQPSWCNMLYFQTVRNAKGNTLRLDVHFDGEDAYRFNHNSATWSYDGEQWRAICWCDPDQPGHKKATLISLGGDS